MAENPDDNLDYHNRNHTNKVYERIEQILTTIMNADPSLVTERDIKLGCLAGAFHDVVQNYNKDIQQDGEFEKIIRKPYTGDNEKASAKELCAFMRKANQKTNTEIFTQKDMDIGTESIEATYT